MQDELAKAAEIFAQTSVPTIPEEVILLKEELNKTYPNTVDIANIISHNPEMLGDFLNLVNTNITSGDIEIKDAKAAVNLLGLEEIFNIFLSSCLTKIVAQSADEKAVFNHGAQAGIAAAELSYWVLDVSRSEAYMAGLMQNAGAIYLGRFRPKSYYEFYRAQLTNPVSAHEKELQQFKTSHSYLGSLIAKKWHMKPGVSQSILLHHNPDFALQLADNQKMRHLVALIMVANYIVSTNDEELYITQELKEYRDLGLKELDLPENALKAAHSAVQKWGKSMGLCSASH